MDEELFTFVLEPEVEADQQFDGAVATRPRAGSQSGPHQQDAGRRPAPQRDRECPGIAAGQLAAIHFRQRRHGSPSVDGGRDELTRPTVGEHRPGSPSHSTQ